MTALPASLELFSLETDTAPCESLEAKKTRAAQAGDMAAFEWIVQQYESRLMSFCFRWLRSEEDAREICQDAFIHAWRALPEFEGRSRLSSWLYRIAFNLCRDRAKTRASKQQVKTSSLDELDHIPACPQLSPDMSAEWTSEMEKLDRGLAYLPENLRSVLMLITLEGLSQIECAEVLNCSLRGVEGRLYRARQMLLEWWNTEA
jgi:RNA polymerase sigma-70 factor (ECF subfamily)